MDNFEHRKAYGKQWKENNTEKVNAHNRRRRACKSHASGYHIENDLQYIYEKQNGICACCGAKIPYNKITVDHIIPLSKGGSDLPINIQLLCGSCNSSKHNTHATDYRKFGTDLLRNKSSIRMIFEE